MKKEKGVKKMANKEKIENDVIVSEGDMVSPVASVTKETEGFEMVFVKIVP